MENSPPLLLKIVYIIFYPLRVFTRSGRREGQYNEDFNEPNTNKRNNLSKTINLDSNSNSQIRDNSQKDSEDNYQNYNQSKSMKNFKREEMERNEKNCFDNSCPSPLQ